MGIGSDSEIRDLSSNACRFRYVYLRACILSPPRYGINSMTDYIFGWQLIFCIKKRQTSAGKCSD